MRRSGIEVAGSEAVVMPLWNEMRASSDDSSGGRTDRGIEIAGSEAVVVLPLWIEMQR